MEGLESLKRQHFFFLEKQYIKNVLSYEPPIMKESMSSNTANTAGTARKPGWETLASPGHVLLARVNSYHLKTRLPIALALAALVVGFFSVQIGVGVARKVGSVTGWIAGKAAGVISSGPPEESPAAVVDRIFPNMPFGQRIDMANLPGLMDAVYPSMKAQVEEMKAGRRIAAGECVLDKKITEEWTDGVNFTPKCRYSKDGDRLWVWAVVAHEQRMQPFIGLVAKRPEGVKYYNVIMPSRNDQRLRIPGEPVVNSAYIPRTIAADFPELLVPTTTKPKTEEE